MKTITLPLDEYESLIISKEELYKELSEPLKRESQNISDKKNEFKKEYTKAKEELENIQTKIYWLENVFVIPPELAFWANRDYYIRILQLLWWKYWSHIREAEKEILDNIEKSEAFKKWTSMPLLERIFVNW